jgi:hypothetical protein
MKANEYIIEKKLSQISCNICNKLVTRENVMMFDFDHIDRNTKFKDIAILVANKHSRLTLDNELAKTRLLCCNCHRLHTLITMYNKDGYYDNTSSKDEEQPNHYDNREIKNIF